MASSRSRFDTFDEFGNPISKLDAPAAAPSFFAGLDPLALAGTALEGGGLLASIVGRGKDRKRAKQQAENAQLEVDNQASTAKTEIDQQAKEQAGLAEQQGISSGLYRTTGMDALRRSIQNGRNAAFAGVDASAARQKNQIGSQLTERLRPGFSPEIAAGAEGLTRSLGALFPSDVTDKPVDPVAVSGGDPTETSASFANIGDRPASGGVAYAGVDDPERIFQARLAFLRGGSRGDTGGDGGLA